MTRRHEAGRLLALTAPIAAAYVGHVGMGWVDTAIVGRVGQTALAGVGLGTSLTTVVALLGHGIVSGLDPIAAQRLGAGTRPRAQEALRDALRLVLPLVGVMVLLVFALDRLVLVPESRVRWLAFEPEVSRVAHEYLWARAPGHLPYVVFAVFRAWLYADHRPGPVLLATLAANLVHLGAGLACVFGMPALGVPAFGAAAIGWVTTLSYALMAASLLPALRADLRRAHEPRTESSRAGCRRILALGLPIGAQVTLDGGIFTAVALLMNALSPLWGSAHQITNQMVSFTFVVALGLGAAAAARVGQAIGRRDPVATRLAGSTATWLGIAWMGAMGLLLWFAPRLIARVFTADPTTLDAAADLLRIAALFQVFDGLQAVGSGICRGAGMTRFPFFANLIGQWVLGLPLGCVLAFHFGLGGPGLWGGLTVGIVAVGALLLWRTRTVLARGVRPLA